MTLIEMVERKWIVTSYCSQCRSRLHVSLEALVRVLGPDYILWGRRPRCRVWVQWDLDRRCPGRVTFHAQASLKGSAIEMKWSSEVDQILELRSLQRSQMR